MCDLLNVFDDMKVIFYERYHLTVEVKIIQDNLLLPDDIILQANDRIKYIIRTTMMMNILFVIFYGQFDNTFYLVNKVQYDRVVFIRR